MFRVKICGITTPADGRCAAEAGADAVGLNFYEKSPRSIDVARACEIAAALPPGVRKVGLFVNAAPGKIREIAQQVGLDVVQLHGDESPDDVAQLAGLTVLKAFRADDQALERVVAFVEECRRRGAPLAGVLIDAHRPGSYGGTGEQANWNLVRQIRERLPDIPLILAGGLTAANVAAAIAAVQPDGVDTASGVECSPGRKDPQQVQAFVAATQTGESCR